MIQAAMQLENEIYKYNEDGSAEFNLYQKIQLIR